MKLFLGIRKYYSPSAVSLNLDYDFADVPDPHAINNMQVDESFLTRFEYSISGGRIVEDLLANNIGWFVVAPRIAHILEKSSNAKDIQLLPLPVRAVSLDARLRDYCVLGIHLEINCLDEQRSEILWSTTPSGERHVLALYRAVLRESAVRGDCDVFHISEYSVIPVVSLHVAEEIAELRPSGFRFEKIEAF